jgi:hypothetical protein
MNEINFTLHREHIIGLKKFHQLKMSKDLIIQRNKKNEIVFSLTDLYRESKFDNKDFTFFELNTEQKTDKKFLVTSKRHKIQLNEKSRSSVILPIIIPPVSEYEVSILLKENKIRMKSKELPFFLYEFALDQLPCPVSVKGDKTNA